MDISVATNYYGGIIWFVGLPQKMQAWLVAVSLGCLSCLEARLQWLVNSWFA
jgi:hypothetical protein